MRRKHFERCLQDDFALLVLDAGAARGGSVHGHFLPIERSGQFLRGPIDWTSFSWLRGAHFGPVISTSIPLTAHLAVLTFVQSVKNLRSTKWQAGPSVGRNETGAIQGSLVMSNRLKVTPNDLSAFWMPFTANRQFKQAPRMFVSRQGHALHHDRRPQGARRHRRACGASMPAIAGRRSPRRSQTRPASSTTRRPSRWAIRSSFELANRLVDIAPAGPRPRVLHQFRLGIGRHRAEDRARLSPREGRRLALPPDRPRARLSRRQFRRHLGRRHRHQPQDVRHAADRRRPHAAHAPACQERLHPRRAGAWRGARRRAGAHRHAARRLDHRRRHRRAGRRLDRRADPAEGLSAEAARDLRQARHPADLRRGHHRLRPPRHAVRRRLFRRHRPTS